MHRRYGNGANLWRSKLMSEKPQSGVKNQHDGKNQQPSLRKMSSPCHGMFEWPNFYYATAGRLLKSGLPML